MKNDHIIVLVLAGIVIVAIAAYFVMGKYADNGPAVVNDTRSVKITVVHDQSCAACPSANPVVNSLKNNGITIGEWRNIDYNSTEGRELIEKYAVEKVPAIVLSENIDDYAYFNELFANISLPKLNGSYVIYLNPPFRDTEKDKVLGIVDVYYIIDPTCADCYNVSIHGDILVNDFKISIGSVLYFDVNLPLGQELVRIYNITVVPAYILTSDAQYYPRLTKVWPSVGTIETTGYYVFRNVSDVGQPYRNLTSGKVVNPVS